MDCGMSFMECLSKSCLAEMVRSFHQLYPTYIHAIREAALQYCKENKISGLAELFDVHNGI